MPSYNWLKPFLQDRALKNNGEEIFGGHYGFDNFFQKAKMFFDELNFTVSLKDIKKKI